MACPSCDHTMQTCRRERRRPALLVPALRHAQDSGRSRALCRPEARHALPRVRAAGHGEESRRGVAQARHHRAEDGVGEELKAPIHTVVFDDRKVKDADGQGEHDDAKRVILYRRGTGSFRLGGMHTCKNMAELKKLIAMDEKELPEGAKRTDGRWAKGNWVPYQDTGGKGYKNKKTGEIVRQRR